MAQSKWFITVAAVCLSCLPISGSAQQNSSVVAQVGNLKITETDLEQQESGKLLQARYQYYLAKSGALDDMIDQKLLEQKAKQENLTVQQLVDRDINSKVAEPTEDQLKIYYEGLETDQPYEAMRPKIVEKIHTIRANKVRTAYLKTLREQAGVVIQLAPPTADINLADANVMGNKDAPVMLVEFADYECPYCQKVAPEIPKLVSEFGTRLAISFKDFPLPMHSHAEKAAEATRCAADQGKYWEYHDLLFKTKELDVDQLKGHAQSLHLDLAKFSTCLDSGSTSAAVQKDRQEGVALGLSGTPSFFINGHYFSGALDYETLRDNSNRELTQQTHQVAMATSH